MKYYFTFDFFPSFKSVKTTVILSVVKRRQSGAQAVESDPCPRIEALVPSIFRKGNWTSLQEVMSKTTTPDARDARGQPCSL